MNKTDSELTSALLERIRAKRAAQAPAGQPRRCRPTASDA